MESADTRMRSNTLTVISYSMFSVLSCMARCTCFSNMDFNEALWNLLDNSYGKGDDENDQLLMVVDILNVEVWFIIL